MRLSQICYLLFEIEPLSSSLMLYGRCRKSESDQIRSDQSLSRVRLCDPMNRSTPGLPVHHQLPEFTETHVHRINGKVMYLLLNMLSRLVITFLPRSKHLLISWLQSPSAVILEPRKIKSDTVSTVSPSISHEVMGPDAMIFVF